MTEQAGNLSRLRLSLNGNEIEIAGSDAFIQEQVARLGNLGELLASGRLAEGAGIEGAEPATAIPASTAGAAPQSLSGDFNAWIMKMPKRKPRTILLWAGYFVQQNANDNSFRMREVNKLLETSPLSLKNPSQTAQSAVKSGSLEKLARGRYRVSRQDEASIRTALGA